MPGSNIQDWSGFISLGHRKHKLSGFYKPGFEITAGHCCGGETSAD